MIAWHFDLGTELSTKERTSVSCLTRQGCVKAAKPVELLSELRTVELRKTSLGLHCSSIVLTQCMLLSFKQLYEEAGSMCAVKLGSLKSKVGS